MYFNTLPTDALTHMIRQLSKRPYVTNWQFYVDSADVLSVLKCGLMAEIALSMFTGLIYGHGMLRNQCGRECSSLQVFEDTQFKQLLTETSPQLRSLAFASERPKDYGFILENCSQLRKLIVKNLTLDRNAQPLDGILKSCGNSLTHLSILGDGQMKSEVVKLVSRHCSAIESLSYYDQSSVVKMDEFFQVIGRTLKRLKCHSPIPPYPTKEAFDCVAQHCKQLEDVEILCNHLYLIHFPIAQFYKNMGNQLRVLRLRTRAGTLTPQVMEEILNECPNVTVDLYVEYHAEEMLRVLGRRARKLRLSYFVEPSPELESAVGTLTGLTELNVCGSSLMKSSKFVEALFNSPKPKLTKLFVGHIHACEYQNGWFKRTTNVLDVLASSVHSLREFECFAINPLECKSFEALLQSNRQLHRFSITYLYNNGSVTNANLEFSIKCIVKSLVKYKWVGELEVQWPGRKIISNEIRNACVPLRDRQLNVIVGEVQYLPTFHSPF